MTTKPKTQLWSDQIKQMLPSAHLPQGVVAPDDYVSGLSALSYCPTEGIMEDANWTLAGFPDAQHHRTVRPTIRRNIPDSLSNLRIRLDKANEHFRRRAAAVLRDKDAVLLLAGLYEQSSVRLEEFDTCNSGVPLAKLAAAGFCDIGSESIYVTMTGREFIESIARS